MTLDKIRGCIGIRVYTDWKRRSDVLPAVKWASQQGVNVLLLVNEFQLLVRPGEDAGELVKALFQRKKELHPAGEWTDCAYVVELPRRAAA